MWSAEIFLAVLLLCIITSANSQPRLIGNTNEKLTVSLYYESMCPFCHNWLLKKLFPVWNQIDGDRYLKLDLVPYGNGRITTFPDGSFNITCQHGSEECKLNEMHNCGLKYIPAQATQLAFICCTMVAQNPTKSGPECAKLLRVDYNPIRKCVNGDEGKYLHYFAGKRTDALQPPHEGVPWIIFNNMYNGEEMDEARTDLLGIVCKKISSPKPAACANYI